MISSYFRPLSTSFPRSSFVHLIFFILVTGVIYFSPFSPPKKLSAFSSSSSITTNETINSTDLLLKITKENRAADLFWPVRDTGFGGGEGPGNAVWRLFGNYSLSSSSFSRSFSYSNDFPCDWKRIFTALNAGGPVSIHIIGGSMTYGTACMLRPANVSENDCAWPAELAFWIHYWFPTWNVTIKNLARGGWDSAAFANDPSLEPSDLYIVDTGINDMRVEVDVAITGYDRLLLRLLTSKSLHFKNRRPAVLLLATFNSGGSPPPPPAWNWASTIFNFSKHYRLPLTSYRDAVWPDYMHPPSNLKTFWWAPESNYNHPPKQSHEMVSDVIKYAFLRLEQMS